MRFGNVKGDTMIPSRLITQNGLKHQASLNLLFDGKGGASQKRKAISVADRAVKTTDIDGVKAVFSITVSKGKVCGNISSPMEHLGL